MNGNQELIRRILLGDPVAPDEFAYTWYYRIRGRIRGQFRSLSDDEVSDLVQGVFEKLARDGWQRLAAWRGLENEEGPELDGYLFAIARNHVLDYLAKQGARREQHGRYEQLLHDDRYDVDHALTGCLDLALARLPARDREIIMLRFKLGLSYREIGDEMGITTNHAGVLLCRALELLESVVAEHYPGLLDKR